MAGGDLEPTTLIHAYRQGIFPMEARALPGVLAWWSPNLRGILPLDRLRVTRSMKQSARRFEIRTQPFIDAYTRLHELGWAHSVEVFDRDGLAGGLYGVRINGLFAGESMFHTRRDASKVALMALVQLMRDAGMTLLDVQWRTDHLESLGAVEVSRDQYLTLLADALG